MKRFFAFLLILVILFAALPSPTPTHAETWIAQATSPDEAHALYADAEQVFLVDNIHGTAITIPMPAINYLKWMDDKSALMNRADDQIFIVDLEGHVFFLGCIRRTNPDTLCGRG